MNTTTDTATAAQVAYITSLREDNGWRLDGIEENGDQLVAFGAHKAGFTRWAEDEKRAGRRVDWDADMAAYGQRWRAEYVATTRHAMTVDTATLTKREASAVIDALKAM